MLKQTLAGLSILSQICVAVPPGMTQIIHSNSQSAQSENSDLSTWEQTSGSGEAWVEAPPPEMPRNSGLTYNVWRAVPANASLGRTIKFGDLSNTYLPNGAQYFRDRNKSMQDLLNGQGQSVTTTKIGDSSYTAGMTLGEVIEANHGQLPKGLESQLITQSSGRSQGMDLDRLKVAGGIAGNLVKTLDKNPVLKEIPLSELASGDFQGALDIGIQRGAQEAIQNLPASWKDLPVGSIAGALASGDYRSALREGLNYGGKRLVEHILKTDALKNLPVGAIAKDLPISELGNIVTAPLSTLPRVASQYLSKIPGLKNASIVQAGVTGLIAIAKGDIAVKLDIAYAGKKENPASRAFTGGTPDNNFTATPCAINSPTKKKGKTNNCGHFQMGKMNMGINPWRYKGMQMVDGQTQWVKGGKGSLKYVNNGDEPAGWKPFGDANGYNPTKLSLKNIKEHPGGNKPAESDIQLDLQICIKFWGKTSCTPHFIPVPTTFKAKQNEYLLLLASGGPPKQIQDAINGLSNRSDYCGYARQAQGDPASDKQVSASTQKALSTGAQGNLRQYLARIAAGESSGGVNIGTPPQSGSDAPYGEYQFRGSTRQAVLNQYPDLDPWSPTKATRDKAALAWIGMYGSEIQVDLLGAIQKGDFVTADKALGKNQFTSLPGGSEASPIWSNPETLAKYGVGGTAPAGIVTPGGSSDCFSSSGGGSSLGAYTGQTSGAFIDPTNGKGPMTSGFGHRNSPCTGCSSNHMGVDFGIPDGTAVSATANGKIVFQGWLNGYGNTIFVDHGNGTMTQYSHLQGFVSNAGSEVKQGAVIALSGHTGVGTGAHLHFGVLQGTTGGNIHTGSYVDPRNFLK